MSEWQPIETVPLDTPVLLYAKEVFAGQVVYIPWDKSRSIYAVGYDGPEFDCDYVYGDLTHWMPLPESPD